MYLEQKMQHVSIQEKPLKNSLNIIGFQASTNNVHKSMHTCFEHVLEQWIRAHLLLLDSGERHT